MHPNSLKNLKPYPPGTSGNPNRGRKQLPAELRAIDSLTQMEVTKLISKYARMDAEELKTHLENKNLPVLELAFCSIFVKSIEVGDFNRLAFLLDRCIGKVKDIVEEDGITEEREKLRQLTMTELLTFVKTNLPEAG